MSDQIVEQVARVIAAVNGVREDNTTPELFAMNVRASIPYARAAIDKYTDAMTEGGFVIVPREPTEAMLDVGAAGVRQRYARLGAKRKWQAMIDAALKP